MNKNNRQTQGGQITRSSIGLRPSSGAKGGSLGQRPGFPPRGRYGCTIHLKNQLHNNKKHKDCNHTQNQIPRAAKGEDIETPSVVPRVSHGCSALGGDRRFPRGVNQPEEPPPRNTARGLRSDMAIERRNTIARQGKRKEARNPPRPPEREAQEPQRDQLDKIPLPKQ